MSESRKQRIREAMERAREALQSTDNHTADEERESMDKPQEPQPIISLPEVRGAHGRPPSGGFESLRDGFSPLMDGLAAGVHTACDDVERVAQEETADRVAELRGELMEEIRALGVALAMLDERLEALEERGQEQP